MDVIYKGSQSSEEMVESLLSIIRLFKEKYGVENFKDIRLSFNLLDEVGEDLELVDSDTKEVFNTFEVYKSSEEIVPKRSPKLKLVVNNTVKF